MPHYPPARRSDVVDTLHGIAVPDPYRWLEDPDSAETRAWVDAQNALTRSALDGPVRDRLVEQLATLYDYPRTSSVQRRGGRYFVTHNPGRLDQPRLCSLDSAGGDLRVLIDPNALSTDGTTALTACEPSPDGRLLAYAISEHGSDRQMLAVLGRDDRLQWVKFASIAWTRDGSGFYYLRFPAPGTVAPGDEQYYGRIYFHRLGDPQARDALTFEHAGDKSIVPLVQVAHGGRWVVITAQRGASDDSEIHLIDRAAGVRPRALFTGFDAAHAFVGEVAGPPRVPDDARRAERPRHLDRSRSARGSAAGSRPRIGRPPLGRGPRSDTRQPATADGSPASTCTTPATAFDCSPPTARPRARSRCPASARSRRSTPSPTTRRSGSSSRRSRSRRRRMSGRAT